MIDLVLTSQEAIGIDHELGLVDILLNPDIPTEVKLKLLEHKRSLDAVRGHEKLKAELDNLLQAQRMLLTHAVKESNCT